MTDQEIRYSQLVQPIRELAKNWEVDVASRLEEYLAELEEVQISFDGGTTSMNFAEAALLIQSSTCVYSKKVEHLYNLVYQALDMVSSKKKVQQASTNNQNDGQDTLGGEQDETQYLDLDDCQENPNIELKEVETQFIDENMNTSVRTPSALLGVEESEKAEKILLSCKGEVIGSRMDYWMNRTHWVSFTAAMSTLSPPEKNDANLFGLKCMKEPNEMGVDKDMNGNEENIDAGMPLADMDDDDFDVDEAVPFENDLPVHDGNQSQVVESRHGLRERRGIEKIQLQTEKPTIDPWKALDAYDSAGLAEKPFKKAKTFKIPTNLQTKKRKRNNTRVKTNITPIDEFIEKAYFSHVTKFPKNPLKVPLYGEFEILFWNEYKIRQAKIQDNLKILREERRYEELAALEKLTTEEEIDTPDIDVGQNNDCDDDDIDDGGIDFGGEDNTIQVPLSETVQPMGFDVQSQEALLAQTYEDLVRKHVDLYVDHAQQYIQETDLSKRIKDWEDKMLPKLQVEEDHGPFDIHHYGSVILDAFNEDSDMKCIPFMEITNKRQPYEICRLFLASLQLANNQNIDIGHFNEEEESMDNMLVIFLSNQRHHENLAEYIAPSLQV